MATVPAGSGSTDTKRPQEIAYYAGILKKLPGTYQGNYKRYDGKTWAELYTDIANSNPTADPKQLADAVLGFEAAQRLGGDTVAADGELGSFLGTAEKAIPEGLSQAIDPLAGLLAPLSELAAVFAAVYRQLTKASMWRSLGWVTLGIILLAAGIIWWAKNEAGPAIAKVAANV